MKNSTPIGAINRVKRSIIPDKVVDHRETNSGNQGGLSIITRQTISGSMVLRVITR